MGMYFDESSKCMRYLSCFDKETQQPISRIDIRSIDIACIRTGLNATENDSDLMQSHRIYPEMIECIEVVDTSLLDFDRFVFFSEAFSLYTPHPDFIACWENAAVDLGIKCRYEMIVDDPFLGRFLQPAVLISEFGGVNGVCVATEGIPSQVVDFCFRNEIHVSILYDQEYMKYARDKIANFLCSLKCFGKTSDYLWYAPQ